MGSVSFHNDHGLLGGLSDDDHTQYVLRSILTTDGDLFSRGAGAITRIAAVASGQVLTSAGTGTLPAWSATPTLTSLTCPTLDGGTAANDDITIQGTTHATRTTSYVILQPNGGNVGIGTTEPVVKLHVSGTGAQGIRITGGAGSDVFAQLQGDRNWGIGMGGGTYASDAFFINDDTAGLNRFLIDNNGNLGLATQAPTISGTGKLHMAADTFRLDTARTPASAGAAGNAGDICWDASFIYVCTATNAWERVAIASW